MKRDKWSRKHLTTGNQNFLEYLAHKHYEQSSDPLQELIRKEEGEDGTEDTLDRFSWDEVEKILSQKDYEILWDYYHEGLTLYEISKKHSFKTPSAVWKRKKQAILSLRKYYGISDT